MSPILFAGGPAPAANAVISTAAFSFLEEGAQVFGIKHGYSRLAEYTAAGPLQEGADYIRFTHDTLTHARSSRGIMIGTARTNPGRHVSAPDHLKDPELVALRCAVSTKVSVQPGSRRTDFDWWR